MSSVTLGALQDELEKIADALTKKEENKKKLKKWLKNTALVAAGTGVGEAAAQGAAHLAKKKFGPAWAQTPRAKKLRILGPAIGAGTAGIALATSYIKKKYEEEDK